MTADHEMIDLPDSIDSVYDYITEQRWGDGLPVMPPTEERVDALLRSTTRDPAESLGLMPPGRGAATVLRVAINATMAGCHPNVMPVVVTAIEAICQPDFNLYSVQATTNPVAVGGFLNGPVTQKLGFNATWNCLGQGSRANATVGRAIRLCLTNIGGARPGDLDRATHGQPAKYAFFFAENEVDSPWSPFHVDAGHGSGVSTVTMFANTGTINILEASEEPEEILRSYALTMRCPGTNDYMSRGGPMLILAPEHARALDRGGYTKERIQNSLWEATQIPARDFSATSRKYWLEPMWTDLLGPLDDETMVPCAEEPSRIRLVVAGGPSIHTVFVPMFGDSLMVTTPITDPLTTA